MRKTTKLINEIKELNGEVFHFMFMDRNTQYCQDVISSQLYVQTQCNPNQNLNKLFSGCQTSSEIRMERQKNQNSQHNIENMKNKIGGQYPTSRLTVQPQ